jgi:tetratricopeptide (TPR) repeat protein
MTGEGRIPPSPYELGVQALNEGRFGDALHAFEQGYHLNPQDPALHAAIGRLYFEQGNYRRAREYLQYALHLAPRATGPWMQLALVEQREGRSDQAIAFLRRVLEIDPEHPEAGPLLEAERSRARIARRLPLWQPARPWRTALVLRPPRQVAPDGRERPAALRAPHPCVNCYFRAGRERMRMHAVRYQWWNLGLVGMLFGGWVVYLLWTYVTREQRFSFDPLLCPTCHSNRRVLGVTSWLLAALAPIFGLTALVAAGSAQPSAGFGVGWAVVATAGTICAACLTGAVLARAKEGGQRGVRLQIAGEEEVLFQFASADYEEAFLQLNRAFLVDRPRPTDQREADSFLPVVEEGALPETEPAPETAGPG